MAAKIASTWNAAMPLLRANDALMDITNNWLNIKAHIAMTMTKTTDSAMRSVFVMLNRSPAAVGHNHQADGDRGRRKDAYDGVGSRPRFIFNVSDEQGECDRKNNQRYQWRCRAEEHADSDAGESAVPQGIRKESHTV